MKKKAVIPKSIEKDGFANQSDVIATDRSIKSIGGTEPRAGSFRALPAVPLQSAPLAVSCSLRYRTLTLRSEKRTSMPLCLV